MNRLDRLRGILWLEALAEKAHEEAGKLRAELNREAVEEFKQDGSAPTWRFPDLATLSLAVSKETAVVTDSSAFLKWVEARYPSEVEHVTKVRESWQRNFLDRVVMVEGDVCAMPGDGEVIPGLGVRPGGTPRSLSIKASPEAKAVYSLVAGEGLKIAALEAGASVPLVVAELEASSAHQD